MPPSQDIEPSISEDRKVWTRMQSGRKSVKRFVRSNFIDRKSYAPGKREHAEPGANHTARLRRCVAGCSIAIQSHKRKSARLESKAWRTRTRSEYRERDGSGLRYSLFSSSSA